MTVKNLNIVDFYFGVQTNGGGNHTFCGDYIANCSDTCINLIGTCDYNNITYCTISGVTAIAMNYEANYNTITENNLTGGVIIWLSGYETVDKNYWSDYLTRYPNASEIDTSGVGNTPYVFSTAQNGSETTYYQDNHPLIEPVNPQATVPEFATWTALLGLLMGSTVVAVVIKRKTKMKNWYALLLYEGVFKVKLYVLASGPSLFGGFLVYSLQDPI